MEKTIHELKEEQERFTNFLENLERQKQYEELLSGVRNSFIF